MRTLQTLQYSTTPSFQVQRHGLNGLNGPIGGSHGRISAPTAMASSRPDDGGTPSLQMNQSTLPSSRILSTDDPIVAQMRRLVQAVPDTASLAQGIVHYAPPAPAMARVQAALADPATRNVLNSYGADEGIPELRARLREKLAKENKLTNVDVFVTHGA